MQRVLPLARHQPRDADDHRPAGQAVPRADRPPSTSGTERLDVHSRCELDELADAAPNGPAQPAPDVLAEIGDDVAAGRRSGAAPAARRAASPSPASCPCVIATHPLGPGRAQRRREQPERRGRAEPDAGAARTRAARRPPAGARPASARAARSGAARTGNGCAASNSAEPGVVGGVDDDRAGRLAHRQLVHERLDAALPRREVVGDDQRAPLAGHASCARQVVPPLRRELRRSSRAGRCGARAASAWSPSPGAAPTEPVEAHQPGLPDPARDQPAGEPRLLVGLRGRASRPRSRPSVGSAVGTLPGPHVGAQLAGGRGHRLARCAGCRRSRRSPRPASAASTSEVGRRRRDVGDLVRVDDAPADRAQPVERGGFDDQPLAVDVAADRVGAVGHRHRGDVGGDRRAGADAAR